MDCMLFLSCSRRHASKTNPNFPRALALLLMVSFIASAGLSRAQTALVNGWMHTGAISAPAASESWTFSANIGDTIVLRVGKITQTNTFIPRIRLLNPAATQIGLGAGSSAVEIALTATNTGTFSVTIDDANGTGTGTYRLTLAKSPGVVSVSPG